MARIIDNQINPWGRQNAVDVQRSDQWVVDFTHALTGIDTTLSDGNPLNSGVGIPYVPPKIGSYFAYSITLPELKVRTEPIRRDARAYPMPTWDDALEPIRIVFLLDCYRAGGGISDPYRSDIYQMLNTWRMCVRAGRGAMSGEFALTLDGNYRIEYAFDVRVMMLRSSSNPLVTPPSTTTSFRSASEAVSNDLEFSTKLRLINCWLGGFKVSELSYEGAKAVQIDTNFYADDVLQEVPSQ